MPRARVRKFVKAYPVFGSTHFIWRRSLMDVALDCMYIKRNCGGLCSF